MNLFESNILVWIQDNLRGVMDPFWIFITHLGDKGLFWIAIGLTLLCFKKTRPAGFAVLISLLINLCITNLTLKPLIARPRPYLVNDALSILISRPSEFSFPSGHTSGSLTAAFALYAFVPKKYGISAVVLAFLIAVSRLYVGVHYPTDILGGIAVAIVSSFFGCMLVRKIGAMWKEKRQNA